jgi:hypothetical protein
MSSSFGGMIVPFFQRSISRQGKHLAHTVSPGYESPGHKPPAGSFNLAHGDLEPRGRFLVGVEAHAMAITHGHEPEIEEVFIPGQIHHHRDEAMVDPAEASRYPSDPGGIYGLYRAGFHHGAPCNPGEGQFAIEVDTTTGRDRTNSLYLLITCGEIEIDTTTRFASLRPRCCWRFRST